VTLVELMVTVAIVAILGAIAYPSYRSYVLRSNRTDAVRALTQAAQILQRCYSEVYAFVGCAGIPPAAPAVELSPNGHYNLDGATTAGPPATFLLVAVPTGSQTQDATCAKFTLDQTGQEVAVDSSGNDQSTVCWGAN
jgi:type IV pilus assembly protein PilE